jgi:hypothetical protein
MDKRSKSKGKPNLSSKKTLIVETPVARHTFLDVLKLKDIVDAESLQQAIEFSTKKFLARAVFEKVSELTFDQKWIFNEQESTFFRIVFKARHPLDPSGTLAAGGRLNIGGAQTTDDFGVYGKMRAGLYASYSEQTALSEGGLPREAHATLYKLESKKRPLRLINLEAALIDLEKHFSLPSPLSTIFAQAPVAAKWELEKTPTVTQIIGTWLRAQSNSDGIKFSSSRDSLGKNVFLFVDSVEDAKSSFSSEKVRNLGSLSKAENEK